MKKVFQIGPTMLALKLDKGRVLGVGTEQKLTSFSNHKNEIQSQQNLAWSKIVSSYITKKIDNNTMKDNVTVVSPNFSKKRWNNEDFDPFYGQKS